MQPPRDTRIVKIRGQMRQIGERLDEMRRFVDAVPDPVLREEIREQMLGAFEAGGELTRLDSIPDRLPVDPQMIGPALRSHVEDMREVYGHLASLREVAAGIFDEQSGELLKEVIREPTVSDTSVTEFNLAA